MMIKYFFFISFLVVIWLGINLFISKSNVVNQPWRQYVIINFKAISYTIVSYSTIYWFIIMLFIQLCLYNNYYINTNGNNSNINIYLDNIHANLYYSIYIFDYISVTLNLTKFSFIFFLLFSILYPVIFALMGMDFNIYYYKLYIYMISVFFLSYYLLLVDNIILFYFIYELILILVFSVMYLSSNARGGVEATLFFAGWAILGSILVGMGVIVLVILTNEFLFNNLILNKLTSYESYYLYMLFFFGFGTKLSIWPFWYWLPKAHVEVSTGMSIFLSCILIKLSYFCLFKIKFLLLSEISFNIVLIVTMLCVIDIVFRLLNLRDLKAIIAYSSVLHTNLLIALVHLDTSHIMGGSVLYVWGHSLATAGLFIVVNMLESRFASRNIIQISGIWHSVPYLGYLIVYVIISFLDLPIKLFFWGEFWLWMVLFNNVPLIAIQIMILCGIIFISFFFKIWWGLLFGVSGNEVEYVYNTNYKELNVILVYLLLIQLMLGCQPSILMNVPGYLNF